MLTKISNKINMLTKESRVLILGTLEDYLHDSINKYFIHKDYFDLNKDSLNILNESFFEQFDIIIFSFNKENFNLFQKELKKIPEKSICLICDDIYLDFKSYLNSSFAVLLKPVSEESFLNKIYSLLSTYELEKHLKTKERIINKYKDETINDKIDDFLDKYSDEIIFINNDLNENLERLKDLDMSKEVFSDISISLIKLTKVIQKNKNLSHLSILFTEFSQFLDSLEIEKVEPSRYNAFDYLTTIIEDLILYIDELFIYRLFKDVTLFEDSMSNNIKYFEAQLLGLNVNEEKDNLEFF